MAGLTTNTQWNTGVDEYSIKVTAKDLILLQFLLAFPLSSSIWER